jgi:hypothetical protein
MKAFAACMAVALALGPAPSFADKPPKSKGKGKGRAEQALVTFDSGEREAAQGYFVEKYGRGGCPPGLAKKANGCLPPGQAKKQYSVGQPLPKGVATQSLPAELSIRIGAPPAGYTYVMVDGDLVKLAAGTMLVVDAIEGLVR